MATPTKKPTEGQDDPQTEAEKLQSILDILKNASQTERMYLAVAPDLVKILSSHVANISKHRKEEGDIYYNLSSEEQSTIAKLALYDRIFKGGIVTIALIAAGCIAVFADHGSPFMGSVVTLLSFTIGSVLSGGALSEFLGSPKRKPHPPSAEQH